MGGITTTERGHRNAPRWARSVGWLTSAHYGSTGTGVLIGESWLLTARHVFEDASTAAGFIVTFNHVEGALPFERDSYALQPEDGFHPGPHGQDFAVVRVRPCFESRKPPGATWGVLPLASAVAPSENLDVLCIHHPEGIWTQCMSEGKAGAVVAHTFLHSASTRKGSSGAPIFNREGAIVGLHVAGDHNEPGEAVDATVIRDFTSGLGLA